MSPYLEDYDGKSIDLSFKGDQIILNNVKIKPIDNSNLPFKIVQGNIKSLVIDFPFADLNNKPVIATIDGLNLFIETKGRELSVNWKQELKELETNKRNMI